jgi:hypothetical protein
MPGAERARWSWALAMVLVLVAAGIAASVVVVRHYGGGNYWPGLVTGMIGTLVAFVLALSWEREREERRLAQDAVELQQRRVTEVRRRLEPVRAELRVNAGSLEVIAGALGGSEPVTTASLNVSQPPGVPFSFVHPQLLEGAWAASVSRLSELVADYELIADLATAYGRIEELRWRLRYRTEHRSSWLDEMTVPLVDELRAEVADLLDRVGRQIEQPSVQPLGLVHTATVGTAVESEVALKTKVIRGNKPEL